MDNTICNAVSKSSESDYSDTQEIQLVDLRDGKVYWVAKLLDGHCWMTQNLDLDLDSNTALVHASSDIGWGSDTGTMSWTPERSTIPESDISSAGVISGWTDDSNNPYSVDTGDWYWIGNWKNNGVDTWYSSATNNYLDRDNSGAGDKFSTNEYTGNGKHGHVGNYYNWSAAIASNDSSGYNDSTVADIANNPQSSICPAGWRLPTVSNASDIDGSTNEFRRLITLYSNTTENDRALTASPLWFVRGGGVDNSNGNLRYSGHYSGYWSSTVSSDRFAKNLFFDPSYIDFTRGFGRIIAYSVRCIARDMSPTNLIAFSANGGVVEGGSITTRRITESQSLGTLPEATREGRAFDGWYTTMDGGTKITDQTIPTGAVTYYAHWATTFDGAYADAGMSKDATSDKYKMHEMTASICETVTTGQTGELVDTRDGTVYHVGKLADDRCWLLDNLALDAVAAKDNLSTTNTNASQAAIDNFKVDSGTAPQDGWATTAVSYETSSSVYNQPRINITSKDVLPTAHDGTDEPLKDEVVNGNWKVGVYYNYCAASIGTYCYTSGSGVDTDATSAIDVKNDICPAGWRMPTGGVISSTGTTVGGGEYQDLVKAITGSTSPVTNEPNYTNFRKALNLALSGFFGNRSPIVQGSGAYVWSSTFYGGYDMYSLLVGTSTVNPQVSSPRYYGQSVRCVADNVHKNLITFNANGGIVEGESTTNRRVAEGQTFGTLPEATKEGSTFDGWYTEMDGGTIITDQTVPTGAITYYAHWIVSFDDAYAAAGKTRDATSGKYRIQDMNKNICDAVSKSRKNDYSDTQETQLVDIRDGKIYWVAKLLDGHCWMTQNLDLDLETTPNHVLALTSENTDLNTYGSNGYDTNNGYSKDANDVITWTPERNTIPTSSITSTGSITGWTIDYNNPYSIDTGDWYWIGNWKNNGTDTWYTSTTNNYLNTDGSGAGDKFSTNEYTGNGKHGHVGNYYNWSATIASNNSASYNASTLADITTNPQNSICPAGWRLPTISNASDTDGSTNEFRRLVTLYGNTTSNDKALTASPLWFVRGGYVGGSSLDNSGNRGYYWSSTVYDSYGAYSLYFYSSSVVPALSYGNRDYGRSVRCIAR